MRSLFKKTGIVLLVIVFLAVLSSCIANPLDQGEIVAYVINNQQKLNTLAESVLESYDDIDYEEAKRLSGQLGFGTIVEDIYIIDDGVVEFGCGGSGNATNSIYVGFYYSVGNTPYPIVFDDIILTETSEGIFEWQNGDGSHAIYTERITENWFYYSAKYF